MELFYSVHYMTHNKTRGSHSLRPVEPFANGIKTFDLQKDCLILFKKEEVLTFARDNHSYKMHRAIFNWDQNEINEEIILHQIKL